MMLMIPNYVDITSQMIINITSLISGMTLMRKQVLAALNSHDKVDFNP